MATVTAPGSVLDHLKSINLGEIDVTGASSDVTVQLPVPLPEGATSVPQTASVTVPVTAAE